MYFPFVCSLSELKYLYVFVMRYFIHTVKFPVEEFIHCYWLALGQVHIGRGLYYACSCVSSLNFLF